jgi:hypothetical protein
MFPNAESRQVFVVLWKDKYGIAHRFAYAREDNAQNRLVEEQKLDKNARITVERRLRA